MKVDENILPQNPKLEKWPLVAIPFTIYIESFG
jgi:hypothetical protein